jgi:hypothetical protein
MNSPVSFSSMAHMPHPRNAQWPSSMAIDRQAFMRSSGWPSPIQRVLSASASMAA